MPRSARSFPFVPGRVALFLVFLLAAPGLAFAQSPGLDEAPLVDPYFDGTFPLTTPGDGSSEIWRAVNAYTHLTFDIPLVFTPLQGTDRIFVASRDGVIMSFVNDPATTTKDSCLNIQSITAVVWDGGFLGLDFHPQFGQGMGKDYMFVYHSAREPDDPIPGGSTGGFFNSYLRLARYEVDPVTYIADPASEVRLFNIRLYNGSHRGGGLTFGGDGMLYLSIGDQFRYETSQDISGNFEGGVIRVDVDMDPINSHPPRRFMGIDVGENDEMTGNAYYIPNDNPFLDVNGGVFEEFWTLGNRAPHRMTYDAISDRFWSGEVGASSREEINIIAGGNNYGWPFREGTVAGPRSEPDSIGGVLTEPVMDFPRTESRTIIGGYIYRGTEHPELYGKYICGDYNRHNLWAVTYDDTTGIATREFMGTFEPKWLGTFGQDLDGEVYLLSLGYDVPIYKFAKVISNGPAPATLSATGFFTDMNTLDVTPAAIPYDINVTFWSDFAIKTRWAILPNDGSLNTAGERIQYFDTGPWTFPEGTVLAKHFDFPVDDTNPSITRRLETRFIVNGYGGETYGITYKWRNDQLDADLLTGGVDEDIVIDTGNGTRTQSWRYPSPGECLDCHNQSSGFALGYNARQLHKDLTYPSTGRTDNQLVTLSAVGFLDPPVEAIDLEDIARLREKDDETAPLDVRARSYLDANCAHCHQPGTGVAAGFDARFSTPLTETNLIRGALLDDLDIEGATVMAPQDPELSMAHIRMLTRGGSGIGMPAIATSVADSAGADLIKRWINLMDADYPVNVAVGKAASQSSTASGRAASRAVDGNTDGVLANGSVTQTQNNLHAWWEVDLGAVYDIQNLRIWNRTDNNTGRTSNVHIFVKEEPFTSTELDTSLNDTTVVKFFHPGKIDVNAEFEVNAPGRYVRVQLDGTNRLHLAEVQVYSEAWFDTPVERPVLGNDIMASGVLDTTATNLVINRSDVYENTEGGWIYLRVDDFGFQAQSVGAPVTPFLAMVDNNGDFEAVAIGSTRLPEEMLTGANTFPFDAIEPPVIALKPGTKLVTGFLDAAADGSGGGLGPVIPFTETGAVDSIWWSGGVTGGDSGAVVHGQAPLAGTVVENDLTRDYHYQISFTRMEAGPGSPAATDLPPVDGDALVRLASPAPNPFNPRTVLRMRLARDADVDWAIYDLRGRRVQTLARGQLQAGEHARIWNGEDHRGARLASGVYFQYLSAGDVTQTNKMVLVK